MTGSTFIIFCSRFRTAFIQLLQATPKFVISFFIKLGTSKPFNLLDSNSWGPLFSVFCELKARIFGFNKLSMSFCIFWIWFITGLIFEQIMIFVGQTDTFSCWKPVQRHWTIFLQQIDVFQHIFFERKIQDISVRSKNTSGFWKYCRRLMTGCIIRVGSYENNWNSTVIRCQFRSCISSGFVGKPHLVSSVLESLLLAYGRLYFALTKPFLHLFLYQQSHFSVGMAVISKYSQFQTHSLDSLYFAGYSVI